jgi:hypothetical protein
VITQIAVGADGDLWGIDELYIYHYSQLQPQWNDTPNNGISQIAVGAGANVWAIGGCYGNTQRPNGPVDNWNAQTQTWTTIQDASLAQTGTLSRSPTPICFKSPSGSMELFGASTTIRPSWIILAGRL